MNDKKLIAEFRKKWGRFYFSDKITDWIKPEKCVHEANVFCVASDDIENDLLSALKEQREELAREIFEKVTKRLVDYKPNKNVSLKAITWDVLFDILNFLKK